MYKNILLYGILLGITLGIYIVIASYMMNSSHDLSTTENIGNVIMLIISAIFIYLGVKNIRDTKFAGYMSFGRVFIVVLLVTVIASIIYSGIWVAFTEISGIDFHEMYKEMVLNEMLEDGDSEEEIEIALEMIDGLMTYYDNPFVKFALTLFEPFLPGVIASLLMGFILKRKEESPTVQSE